MAGEPTPPAASTGPATAKKTSWTARLGWGHRGFRVASQRHAAAGLALLLLLPFLGDMVEAWFHGIGRAYDDLDRYRVTAVDFARAPTAAIYENHPEYLYPPFFLTWITPLFALPGNYAPLTFELLKWVALAVSLRLAWRLAAPPGEDVPPIVAIGSVLLTARFFGNDIAHGNINVFILLLGLSSVWMLARGWLWAAGFLVGVAACIKVTPGLLLAYFVYKGWWRTLWGAALAGIVCLFLWPAALLGWENNWQLLTGWHDHVLAGFLRGLEVPSFHSNQAPTALLNRLLGPYESFEPQVHLAPVILPVGARNLIRTGISLAVLAGLALACRRRLSPSRQPLALAAEVGLVQLGTLMFSGYSWKAHFVVLLLPYAVLLTYLADARYPARPRTAVKWWLLASFVLCLVTSDIITHRGADYAEAFGLILFGALAAAGGLLAVRRSLTEPGHAP